MKQITAGRLIGGASVTCNTLLREGSPRITDQNIYASDQDRIL